MEGNEGNIQRFKNAPLQFNGLVVEFLSKCNASCAMCYQAAGPRGSSYTGNASLDMELVSIAALEAYENENISNRFHLAGGEAFLRPNDCYELFEVAKAIGYREITTTTNCFWAASHRKADYAAKRLADSGVTSVEISWDIWHLPYIKPIWIDQALISLHTHCIETNLRVLGTKSHSYYEALKLISPEALDLASRVTCGPVFWTGRAKQTLDPSECSRSANLHGTCFTALNFTVNARGDVSPCCAGFDQNPSHTVGNIRDHSIAELYERMNTDPVIRALVFLGPKFLASLAQHEVKNGVSGICELCCDLFDDPTSYSRLVNTLTRDQSLMHDNADLNI